MSPRWAAEADICTKCSGMILPLSSMPRAGIPLDGFCLCNESNPPRPTVERCVHGISIGFAEECAECIRMTREGFLSRRTPVRPATSAIELSDGHAASDTIPS